MPLTRAQKQTCLPHIEAYLQERKNEVGYDVFDKINREKKGLVNVSLRVFQPKFVSFKENWWSKQFNLGVRTHLHAMSDLSIKSQVLEFVKSAFAQVVECSSDVEVCVFSMDEDLYASVSFCQ